MVKITAILAAGLFLAACEPSQLPGRPNDATYRQGYETGQHALCEQIRLGTSQAYIAIQKQHIC